jgi:hypothetical protein
MGLGLDLINLQKTFTKLCNTLIKVHEIRIGFRIQVAICEYGTLNMHWSFVV